MSKTSGGNIVDASKTFQPPSLSSFINPPSIPDFLFIKSHHPLSLKPPNMPTSETNTSPPPQSPPPSDQNRGSFTLFLPIILGGETQTIFINPLTASAVVFHGGAEQDLNQSNKDGRLPASKKSIEGMPVVKITAETYLESCAICLGEYEEGGEAKEMPCKHKYHPGCIERWLGIHGSCPVCRFEMPLEEQGDEGLKGSGGEEEEDMGRRREIRISIFFESRNDSGSVTDGSSNQDMVID